MESTENTPIAAVLNLQTYLRQISYDTPGMTQPPVNGSFGYATQRSLEEFQAAHGLPVTGMADQATWEALYDAYRASLTANGPRERMDIFPRAVGRNSGNGQSRFCSCGDSVYAEPLGRKVRLDRKCGDNGRIHPRYRRCGQGVSALQRLLPHRRCHRRGLGLDDAPV